MQKAMGASRAATVASEHITWRVAHEALSRLARERAAADAEEGRWLLAAQRSAAHVHLGFSCFSEYIERLFGYKPHSLQEKLRVAESLEELPALAQALSNGELSWAAVRELTRVVVRETEHDWLQLARGKTLRQLEQLLAGRYRGDGPGSPPDLAAQRHVLRFEVEAETFALFRDALNELRRRTNLGLDDDSALLEMARQVLGGPRDEGRASYQISLSVCPECSAGRQQSAGGLVPVGPDVIRMAHCDAQHLGLIAEQRTEPANDFDPRVGDVEHESAAERPGGTDKETDRAGAHGIENQSSHVGGSASSADGFATKHLSARGVAAPRDNATAPRRAHLGTRARQTIPPAMRRAVLLRDQRRCQIPGCQNTRFVDVHHLELRSEGGPHTLDNLACTCSAHHRAIHRGQLLLDRNENGTLRARHADGSEYGSPVSPQSLETRAKIFSALRHLGFREGEVRAAMEQLRGESVPKEASFDCLFREALARLCRPAGTRQ